MTRGPRRSGGGAAGDPVPRPLAESIRDLAGALADGRFTDDDRKSLRAMLSGGRYDDVEEDVFRAGIEALRAGGRDAGAVLDAVLRFREELAAAARWRRAKSPLIRVGFDRGCLPELLDLLARAEQTIDVCVFAVAEDRLKTALLAAHRRRVAVRLLTEEDTVGNDGADAMELEAAGIDLHLEVTPALMHHKFVVVDSRFVMTGSLNWTRKASETNYENIVILDDGEIAAAFTREFERLWAVCRPGSRTRHRRG